MAPSAGSWSMAAAPSGVPPAVISARTLASCSGAKTSLARFPAASRRSNRSPMRVSIDLGKREWIRTGPGMRWAFSKHRGRNWLPNSALGHKTDFQAASAQQSAGLHFHAGPHGGGHRDALDIGALGTGGLGLGDRVRERLDVLHQLLFRERRLADAGLHDARLLDTELDRTALGALHGAGDVHGHGPDLRVRHHAARTEHLTETSDQRHHVGGRDAAVELDRAALHLLH